VAAEDRARVAAGFDWLRAAIGRSGPDPWLCFSPVPSASLALERALLPGADEAVDAVRAAAGDADLVGFHASGPLARGFASSLGHAHWHEADAWFFDHSIHVGEGQAVKATLAGGDWSAQRVAGSVRDALAQAALLRRPALQLAPGSHRSYLAPAAVAELLGLLAWDGFSARAHRSGHASLARLRSGAAALDARLPRIAQARAPRFQADGFTRPARAALVDGGRFDGWLVSPRSGREFGLDDNGAADAECPEALSMAGGGLPGAQALARLGTGVAIGNLWYLNFSDREACRITGMTRFAASGRTA
jgi:predicted Zn-dependent protease